MTATKKQTADDCFVIVEQCAEQLSERGRDDLAEQVRVLAQTAMRDSVTVTEAAKLACVSVQTIKNWISRGVVASSQLSKGTRHRVDRASLMHTIQRRAAVNAAREAFAQPATAVEYLSGLDKATLDRLGGI